MPGQSDVSLTLRLNRNFAPWGVICLGFNRGIASSNVRGHKSFLPFLQRQKQQRYQTSRFAQKLLPHRFAASGTSRLSSGGFFV
jgi:hypothetical protein